LEPPLVLVCVGREAKLREALDAGAGFALNVLASLQEPLSVRFASGMDDPFEGVGYSLDPEGIPLLNGALAHIRCASWGAFEAGDHTVFFGLVLGGSTSEGAPLVRYRSNYTTTERR
jgi:flavin reductase (DIM6/NTAB) family NADH-FMN oxidoreductase RutF